jgi:hypothetical protein
VGAERFGKDEAGNPKGVKFVPLNDGHETHVTSMADVAKLKTFAAYLATAAEETHKTLDGPIAAQERKLNAAGLPDWVCAATLLEGAIAALDRVGRKLRR